MMQNSSKSTSPLPSTSTSLIISFNSAYDGLIPSYLMIFPISDVEIVPSPSLSNNLNAARNSSFYASVILDI